MSKHWDKKFIELCNHIANWSKDNSTKVGSVIVNRRNKILSIGYNGLPIGVDDTKDKRNERPTKYLFYEHAERNAIYSAAEEGISLKGCILYCNYFPCADCARAIIQSGIKEVIYQKQKPESAKNSETWIQSMHASLQMMLEAKVRVRSYSEMLTSINEKSFDLKKFETSK